MHFFRVYGGNSFEEKKPHPMGIELLMQESGIGRADAPSWWATARWTC